jgi:hypothetical protein
MPGLKTHRPSYLEVARRRPPDTCPIFLERSPLSRFDPCHSDNKSATPYFAYFDANNPERQDQQGFTIRLENICVRLEGNTCNTVTASIVVLRAPN